MKIHTHIHPRRLFIAIALATLAGIYQVNVNAALPFAIVSLQHNGSLVWTTPPGTNVSTLEWTPSLTRPVWTYAAPPLDLIISTNSRNTNSVPILPPIGFYRLAQGLPTWHGVWIATNGPGFYLMPNGQGLITNTGIYNVEKPPGTYGVTNANVSLTVISSNQTFNLTGQFVPPRSLAINGAGTFVPVEDLSLCAGTWSGTLIETNDPNGLTTYALDLNVDANGFATVSGNFTGSGWMFALSSANGVFSSFFRTTSTGPYDQFRIIGILNGNTITASYGTDSGSGANAVAGTVTLTR